MSREEKIREIKVYLPEKIYVYWVYKPKVNRKNPIPCSFCDEMITAGEPFFEISLGSEDVEKKTGHIQHLCKSEKKTYTIDVEKLTVGTSPNSNYHVEEGEKDQDKIKTEIYSALHQAYIYRISTSKTVPVEINLDIPEEVRRDIDKINKHYKVKLTYK